MPTKKQLRKDSKLVGRGIREDVLLDTINISYLIKNDENNYLSTYNVIGRVDVTEFINPVTGSINVSIDWLLANVKGFKDFVEFNFQEHRVVNISLGLRSDKYKIEWRKKSGDKEGFKRSVLSNVINPSNS